MNLALKKSMKISILYLSIFSFLLSCKNQTDGQEKLASQPKTIAEIVQVKSGSVEDNLELLASTTYLKRNISTAPIASYITKVNISLGDKVAKGQLLYELESKEHRAVGNQSIILESTMDNFGIIQLKAQASGIVSTLDKQQTGDYVLEGTRLCTIAESSDLAFQINVPFEYKNYVKTGDTCKAILPDGSSYLLKITQPLTTMNSAAQTQTVLAKPIKTVFLPESLTVKVLINKGNALAQQIVPQKAVQSDEMLQHFWVMKLINDSMAVKVPVEIGSRNKEKVEILSPIFNATDRIISTGSYHMADSTLVKISTIQLN